MREVNDSICIKTAETDEELCGRGYVHCTSWQEAYRGIVCDRYLDTMTVEQIGRRRVGKECNSKCRSRWSPYH